MQPGPAPESSCDDSSKENFLVMLLQLSNLPTPFPIRAVELPSDSYWVIFAAVASALAALGTFVVALLTLRLARSTNSLADETKRMADQTESLAQETQKSIEQTFP
jgi:hypothetical protein